MMSKNVNLNLSGVHLHQLTAGSGDGWGKSSMGIVNLGKSYDSNSICDNVNVSLTNSCIYLEGSYNRGFSSFGYPGGRVPGHQLCPAQHCASVGKRASARLCGGR